MVSADRSIERRRWLGRRSVRRATAATALILGVTLVAACGESGSGASGSSAATSGAASQGSDPAEANSPAGTRELTVWHAYVGQDDKVKFMQGALDEFQNEHPEITLNVVGLEQNAYKTKLQTALHRGGLFPSGRARRRPWRRGAHVAHHATLLRSAGE